MHDFIYRIDDILISGAAAEISGHFFADHTGHGIDGTLQQRFFAGETEHILLPFLSNDFCHASQKENIN